MGYYARYTGTITVEPPLPWNLIKDHPALPSKYATGGGDTFHLDDMDVKLDIHEIEFDTEEGPLLKRTATGVSPWTGDSIKGYRMLEHLQSVVDIDPNRKWTGHIHAVGEDGAQWRFAVAGGTVREYRPELAWPEEAR